MIRKLVVFLAGICLGCVASATTYTYVGSTFNFTGGSGYTTSGSITGSFTTAAPLPTDMALTDIGPAPGGSNLVTGWSFTDGLNTYTQANSIPFGDLFAYFRVQTDSFGNISQFYIELSGPLPPNSLNDPMHVISMISSGAGSAQSQGVDGALCTTVTAGVCTAVGPGPNYGDSTSSGAFTPNFVALPPTISKGFGAATIPVSGSTSLSFTITNPNAGTTLTGVGVTDSLPAGLVVSTPNGLVGSCGGGTITATAGSASVSLSGATLAGAASCTFGVNVTGSSAGAKFNTTGAVSSNEGGAGGTASASLTVVAPPTITKGFGAATILVNGSTSLSFTITNPNAGTALTGVGVTDSLPAGLAVSTPNGLVGTCGGGTITATAGSTSVSLSGATLAGGASCTFGVNVTGSSGGTKFNTTGAVSSNEGGAGGTASASVTVLTSVPTLGQWAVWLLGLLILVAAAGATSRPNRYR